MVENVLLWVIVVLLLLLILLVVTKNDNEAFRDIKEEMYKLRIDKESLLDLNNKQYHQNEKLNRENSELRKKIYGD